MLLFKNKVQPMRVLCPILVFSDHAAAWTLPNWVTSLEIISADPQTVLYFSLFLQKDNHYRSLFCFMHRSTTHSPSHPLFQVRPHMTTTFCLKIAKGIIRKESGFLLMKKLFSRKAGYSYSQHGTIVTPTKSWQNNYGKMYLSTPVVILNWAICSSTLPPLLPSVSVWWGETLLWHNMKVPSAPCTEPEEKGAQLD